MLMPSPAELLLLSVTFLKKLSIFQENKAPPPPTHTHPRRARCCFAFCASLQRKGREGEGGGLSIFQQSKARPRAPRAPRSGAGAFLRPLGRRGDEPALCVCVCARAPCILRSKGGPRTPGEPQGGMLFALDARGRKTRIGYIRPRPPPHPSPRPWTAPLRTRTHTRVHRHTFSLSHTDTLSVSRSHPQPP